jgi:hypothetical protein
LHNPVGGLGYEFDRQIRRRQIRRINADLNSGCCQSLLHGQQSDP